MLRLAIPKGSLEEGTLTLFQQADLSVIRGSSRGYSLGIDDPRISEMLMLRPQEIPRYVSDGEFDLGISGLDWIVETGAAVQEVADIQFSKRGWKKVKIVLATDIDNPIENPRDISAGSRVVTEYPRITRRYFGKLGKAKISIRGSYGATEVKVPRLADYLVDVTETGQTLMANGKKILGTLLVSSTRLIANTESWKDPEKRKAIEEIKMMLLGVVRARDKALIKMNVPESKLERLVKGLPSLRSPSISRLYTNGAEEEWFMIETVVVKEDLNVIVPEIKALGAEGILEVDISKMIP